MESFWFWAVVVAVVAYIIGRASMAGRLATAKGEANTAQTALYEIREQMRELQSVFDEALRGIRKDSALLHSLVRWSDALQEARDLAITQGLVHKRRPARKAAEEVRAARFEARQSKRELNLTLNRLALYESLAPWLAEYTELTVDELIEALREEAAAEASEEDPVSLYVPKAEWSKLTLSQRNQLALDRYCDSKRRKTPWAAGIQYERFIGYTYEKAGCEVEYRGAVAGREDLGVDLVCTSANQIQVVQCKRLSAAKGLPVRENTIAQIYGSAEYYRMATGTTKPVIPVLITTYKLSDEARRFARHLKVNFKEMYELMPYPMIKCNVARADGERIYHLPMDQQYDNVIIGDAPGEFYATTVNEAEAAGFRRAFRWRGSN